MSRSDAYRADIDALRAIAVLAVIAFHVSSALLPGGFVGVDIFFVISGYLISKHVAAEAAEGSFSLAEFYRRRIRRIVPMMLLVTAATLAASLLMMTPDDARAVARSAVWALASAANIHFWHDMDTSYFANSSAEVPLLHLWSLGVEEQFYILWPPLLVAGVRRVRPAWLLAAIGGVALLSFATAALVFRRDASFAYFMLPTRAGELLLGALLGVAMALGTWRPGIVAARTAGWVGVGLLAFSLAAISSDDPFPGWLALPPTLGAALLILAGERAPQPVPGLASRPLVVIGRLSYSAYLWHWPLLAIWRYGYGEPGWLAGSTIVGLTFGLAWASYRLVELPTRRTSARLGVVAMHQLVAPGLPLLLAALAVVYASKLGLPLTTARYADELGQLREVLRPAYAYDWICQRQRIERALLADPRCINGAADGAVRTLMWGDSNAAHYVPMMREIAIRAGTRFRNVEVGSCPPLFVDPAVYVDAHRLADCLASTAAIRGEINRYPVLVISAAWSTYQAKDRHFMDAVTALLRELHASGHTVILIGRAPVLAAYDRRCAEKALRLPFKTCPDAAEPLTGSVVAIDAQLRQLAESMPGVTYFDANSLLCPNGLCGRRTSGGLPRFYDESHLSVPASTELGSQIVARDGVPAAFAALVR